MTLDRETEKARAEEKRARAERFQAWYESDGLKEAFDDLEKTYLAAWKQTRASDTAGREKAHMAVINIDHIRQHMISVIENGKMAQATIKAIEKEIHSKKSLFTL